MKKYALPVILSIIFLFSAAFLFFHNERNKVINVCFITDNKYVKHTLVTIYSILKNNKSNSKYNFYILTDGLTKENNDLIKNYVIEKKQNVEIFKVDNFFLEKGGCYGNIYLPPIVLSRLYIGSVLPINVKKCIYLDSDILVISDLRNLYNKNLGKNIVGMVKDPVVITKPYIRGKKYYNTGVMLINLEKWRNNNIEQICINLVQDEKYMKQTLYKDQDIINTVLKGKIKNLDNKYNFYVDYRYKDIKKPYIIHYLGLKPWRNTSDWLTPEQLEIVKKSPKYDLYYKYEKEFNVELERVYEALSR